jgi:hypothetical protein
VNFHKTKRKGFYESPQILNKYLVEKHRSRIKRTLSKPADTTLRYICERTQIRLDWIFCEFSQTQMYSIFVNAHRTQFTGCSVKTYRSKCNRPRDFHQTQISEKKNFNTDKSKFTAYVNANKSSSTGLLANIRRLKFKESL